MPVQKSLETYWKHYVFCWFLSRKILMVSNSIFPITFSFLEKIFFHKKHFGENEKRWKSLSAIMSGEYGRWGRTQQRKSNIFLRVTFWMWSCIIIEKHNVSHIDSCRRILRRFPCKRHSPWEYVCIKCLLVILKLKMKSISLIPPYIQHNFFPWSSKHNS